MVLGWGVKAVLVGMEELGSEYGVRSRHGELAGTDTDMACASSIATPNPAQHE